MTREEAIEAIKCNWPDSRYTILREALDMAISALREQDENMLVDAVGSNGEWMDEDFRYGTSRIGCSFRSRRKEND